MLSLVTGVIEFFVVVSFALAAVLLSAIDARDPRDVRLGSP